MTALRSRSALGIGVGALAAVAYVAMAVVWPRAAAGGWLIAFLFLSNIALGGLLALMINRVTGGAWGPAHAAAFAPAAAATPLVGLMLLPVFALLPAFYPWANDGSAAPADVAHWYLAIPWFAVRSVVAFCGWTAILIALSWAGRAGTLAAAIGLVFHAVMIGLVGVDWVQSLEPPFMSTAFGASLAASQLAAALAFALVLAPAGGRATADLAGLLLATLLGLTYLEFMSYLVLWYGDVPDKIAPLARRATPAWVALIAAAFVLACLLPIGALLLARVRRSARLLRVIGIAVLVGLALYEAWLIAPVYGAPSLVAAVLATLASAALIVTLAMRNWPRALFDRGSLVHAG